LQPPAGGGYSRDDGSKPVRFPILSLSDGGACHCGHRPAGVLPGMTDPSRFDFRFKVWLIVGLAIAATGRRGFFER
ncbi:MAG: hypothetical protein NT090_03195, partial [Acidobacteria bacterium]|nr:hypothetical protein [Acidobacteriota bacterium]